MSLQEQLFAAAKAGNHLEIRRLMIQYNTNFQDLRDDNGHSLLHITSHRALFMATKFLLNEGFDVNLTASNGNMPLHYAVKSGDSPMVALLLKHGALPDEADQDGYRPIHLAIISNNEFMVEKLFWAGVQLHNNLLLMAIEKSDEKMISLMRNKLKEFSKPLMDAAKRGNTHEVQNWLNRGADPTFRDECRWTPLHWAVINGHFDVVEILLRVGVKLDSNLLQLAIAKSDEGIISLMRNKLQELNKSLMNAAKNGNTLEVQNWLNQGADPTFIDEDGWSALHWAVKNNHIDMINLLSKPCANLKNGCNESALYLAVANNQLDAVDALYNNACNMNAKNGPKDNTALHQAVVSGNMEMTKKLLECGVQTDVLNNEGEAALHIAVKIGNPQIIDQFMICNEQKTIDFNIKTNNGCTPLYFAVLEDKLWITTKLIEAGSDVNATNGEDKSTALHIAAQERNTEIVGALLERKADITLLDNDGYSALHYAVLKGSADVINILLKAGADVNVKNSRGETPLILATINNHLDVVIALLNAGSDMNAANDENKWSALHFAAYNGDEEIISALLKKNCKELIRDNNGDCPIHLAAYHGKTDVIKSFKSLNFKSSDNETPLYLAVSEKHYQTVKELLKNGCDKNSRNGDPESTALHRAVAIEDEILVKMLLEHKVDYGLMDKNDLTALHLAVVTNKPNIIKTFKNSNLNVKNAAKITPLYLAVQNGFRDVALELIKLGCDINAKNCNEEFTALHQAFLSNNTEIIKILLENKAGMMIRDKNGSTVMHMVAEKGKTSMIRYFKGYNINVKNTQGETPLYLAVRNCHYGTTGLLIQEGSKINEKNGDDQCTVLHEAVRQANEEILEILLAAHPDTSLLDKKGFTALHYAITQDNLEIVKMFISKNIGLNNKNMDGNTPLHDAVKYKKISIVEALLNSKADQSLRNAKGHCPLHIAVDEEKIIDCFIKNKAQLNLLTKNRETVLQMVMTRYKNDLNKRKALIGDSRGCTLLHNAVRDKNINMAKMLVKLGASAGYKDNDEKTALIYAIGDRNKEMVDILYSLNAFSDTDKYLPLQIAVEVRNKAIVELLLNKGYDVNLTNYQNKHALHLAIEKDDIAMVEFLFKKGASVDHEDTGSLNILHYVAECGNKDIYDMLKTHTDFNKNNTQSNNGETPLYLAVNKGHLEIVTKILNDLNKANLIPKTINAKNGAKSQTILHAASMCSVRMVDLILSYDPCLSTQDSEGNTALHCAVLSVNVETVEKLLAKSGKEMYIKNSKGETPLEMAKRIGPIISNIDERQKKRFNKIIEELNNHKGWW